MPGSSQKGKEANEHLGNGKIGTLLKKRGETGGNMISVIVPIYNVENYLPQCIESIISQTYQDLEIILVDDGSTDSCGGICDTYAEKDLRIKVIHKENGGLVSARKAGIMASGGEYIGYVDGDDWIEPDMYEKLHGVMNTYNADIVMCGHFNNIGSMQKQIYHDAPDGKYDKTRLKEHIFPKMISGDSFFDWSIAPGVWDKLFRKESVIQHQLAVNNQLRMGEDAACVYPALLNAESIYILHECLYHYRQTTSSMVKSVQDYGKEREQFGVLYHSVNKIFEKCKDIFDVREQWLKYVLFLMIPRSDGLYAGYSELDYLFPFSGVRRGSDIVLYGAGTYGQRLHGYLQRTGFCKVILWLDRDYAELREMGLEVDSPTELETSDCYTIVIANTYELSRKRLYKELVEKYPDKKVHMIDEKLIFSNQTKKAFGLDIEEDL